MQGWGWFIEVIQLSNSHAGVMGLPSMHCFRMQDRGWFNEVIQVLDSHAGGPAAVSYSALTLGCRVGVGL